MNSAYNQIMNIPKDAITLQQAATITGYTESYLRQLLRAGSICGAKLNQRCWVVSLASVQQHSSSAAEKQFGRPRASQKNG